MNRLQKMLILGMLDSGTWTPAKITGLRLWLKADAGLFQDAAGTTPAAADGDPVGLWQDQSGNGYHVSQTTDAARPLLKLGVNGINSQPALSFDGSALFLSRTVANWLSTDSQGFIAAVINLTGSVSDQHLLTSSDAATANYYVMNRLQRAGSTKISVSQKNGDTTDTVDGTGALLGKHIVILISDGTAYSFRLDSAASNPNVIAGANNGDWYADTINRDNFAVGAWLQSTASAFYKGLLSQVLVGSVALAGSDLTNLEAYLTALYVSPP